MDIYDYTRKAFPKLVQQRLEQLQKSDKTATFERALREVAKENAALYESYCHAIGG